MKLILFIASAAILGFSGLAAANTPASWIIDTALTADIAAHHQDATQARREEPLLMAPTGCTHGCGLRTEPLLMAPRGCGTSCTRTKEEPLRMAPNCLTCNRRHAEPLRVAPTCGSKCQDKLA